MEKEQKVWIRGIEGRGTDITQELEKIGILEDSSFICDNPNRIYFIDHNLKVNWVNIDTEAAQVLMEEYTELKLDTKKEKYHFEPFDKVLVRDDDKSIWKVDFFSHKTEGTFSPFKTVGNYYRQCIPYNEETKHLVGTADNW